MGEALDSQRLREIFSIQDIAAIPARMHPLDYRGRVNMFSFYAEDAVTVIQVKIDPVTGQQSRKLFHNILSMISEAWYVCFKHLYHRE